MAAPGAKPAAELEKKLEATPVAVEREYVSGGSIAGLSALNLQALGQAIDDVERDFGTTTYEKMMRDPACYGSVETLKTLALAEPLRIIGKVKDKDDPDYEQSELIRRFVADNIDRLVDPLQQTMHEMLDALWRGHYIAEKVLSDEVWEGQVRLMLDKIKPKHPVRTGYAVDRFNNVLGIVMREPSFDGTAKDLPTLDGMPVVPRDRFFIMRFWGVAGDPRGQSILRPAYNAWYLRQLTWPAYLKFLIQFATPSYFATAPEKATNKPDLDDDGNVQTDDAGRVIEKTPEERLVETLIGFQGGTAAAAAFGTSLTVVESKGDGKAFIDSMDLFKREIVLAVLRVTRATMESQHGSKADSEVAQDVLGVFVRWIRTIVETTFERDVIRWLVKLNFGDEGLKLCPSCSLSAEAQEDLGPLRDAIAKLWAADYIDESQVPELDAKAQLPERDMTAWSAKRADAADAARQTAGLLNKVVNPGAEEDPSAGG